MYYPDLSLSQPVENWPVRTYVGWLEPPNLYSQGATSLAFQERLLLFCAHPKSFTMGIHDCPYCDDAAAQLYSLPNGTYLQFGSVEVWIFGKARRIYVALASFIIMLSHINIARLRSLFKQSCVVQSQLRQRMSNAYIVFGIAVRGKVRIRNHEWVALLDGGNAK